MHILMIEDDADLGSSLQMALRQEGVTSEWLRRADPAPRDLDKAGVDCVLLDLTLPDASGFDLLARWRCQAARTPIIIITARTSLHDRLQGLDGGADDVLIKPFAPSELVARIHAVVRRTARQVSDRWVFGDLEIEPRQHRALLQGAPLDLTPREFQLLVELASKPNAVVSKRQLAQRLEPLGEPLELANLEMHVSNLRKKIGAAFISTVRGVGYQWKG
jgi:two-component system response regulator QseB